jgi:hypothetical protein
MEEPWSNQKKSESRQEKKSYNKPAILIALPIAKVNIFSSAFEPLQRHVSSLSEEIR